MGWAHVARYRGRVGPTKQALGHFLAWGFLYTPSSSPKRDALIFPELSEAVAVAEILILFEGGQILLLRRGGKSPPSSSPLLLGVGGDLYITVITITSTISITISVIHSVPPHSLRVAIP